MQSDGVQIDSVAAIPCQVDIAEVISSRYPYSANERPLSWDERVSGHDVVLTTDGQTLRLMSDGQQSPPNRGWGIVLTGGNPKSGYQWTLYSLPKGAAVSSGPRI